MHAAGTSKRYVDSNVKQNAILVQNGQIGGGGNKSVSVWKTQCQLCT